MRLTKLDDSSGAFELLDESGHYIDTSTGSYPLRSWPTSGVAYYVASLTSRKYSSGQPVDFTLELQLVDPAGAVVCSDDIQFGVAPLILSPECNSAVEVYSSTLNIAGIPGLDVLNTSGDKWTQDQVKFTKVQCSPGANSDVYVLLGHTGQGNLGYLLTSQKGLPGVTWQVGGDGGNMMATPPLPGYPYGKLLLGSKCPGSQSDWSAQNIQQVVTTLDTSWLYVGHVDEVLMFIAPNKVLFADPWTAADLLHQEIAAGNGANTIWAGPNSSSTRTLTITSVVVAATPSGVSKLTTLPTGGLPNSTATATLTFSSNPFQVGDVLRVDNELLMVQAVDGPTVTVSRAQAGRPAAAHAADSVIYAYSSEMIQNLPVGSSPNLSPVAKMASVINALSLALGSYASSVTFVPMPVIFYKDSTGTYSADTANVVNCLVGMGGTIYYQGTGCTAFENYISTVVPGAQAVDAWDELHLAHGEIHCGTAVRRSLNASPPWWQQVPTDWN